MTYHEPRALLVGLGRVVDGNSGRGAVDKGGLFCAREVGKQWGHCRQVYVQDLRCAFGVWALGRGSWVQGLLMAMKESTSEK